MIRPARPKATKHDVSRVPAYGGGGNFGLKGEDDLEPETEIAPARAEDLRVTATGQVATSLDAADVWSLNNRRLDEIQAAASPLPVDQADQRAELRRRIIATTAYEPPGGPPKTVPYGIIRRDGYRVEKLTYESEPGIVIPALLFLPEDGPPRKPAVIDVDDRGKSTRAAEGGPIEGLVRDGRIVLAVDLRGYGETGGAEARTGSAFATWFGAYDSAMTALLIGRPLVGFRMRDVAAGLELLAARDDVDASRLEAIGAGRAAVPLLHMTVLESRVAALRLERAPLSYEAIVRSRAHQGVFDIVVPGVLKAYDLPALMGVLEPRPVVVDPLDPMGVPLTSQAAERLFGERARLEFSARP